MSNLIWRDRVPDGSRLILTVARDPETQLHDYAAGAKIWAENKEVKVAKFDHGQLSNDGWASFTLSSTPQLYTVHLTVTFSGSAASGAIISSRIEKPDGTLFGTSPDPHPVAGQSGDVGWQTISIRMRS